MEIRESINYNAWLLLNDADKLLSLADAIQDLGTDDIFYNSTDYDVIVDITNCKQSITTLNDAITSLNSQITTLTTTNGTLTGQLTTANNTITSLNATIVNLNNAITSNDTTITSLNSQLTTANATIASLNSQITSLNSQLTTANNTITSLNAQLASSNVNMTFNYGITTNLSFSVSFWYLSNTSTDIQIMNFSANAHTAILNSQSGLYIDGVFKIAISSNTWEFWQITRLGSSLFVYKNGSNVSSTDIGIKNILTSFVKKLPNCAIANLVFSQNTNVLTVPTREV
jgi:uncharacterized coiled-coil protein SlyX